MHFPMIVAFLLYANAFAFFRSFRRDGVAKLLAHIHHIALLIGGAGFVLGIGLFDNPEKGIHPGAFNWCVPLFFIFGLMSVLLFGWKLILSIRDKSDKSTLSWRSGVSLMAVMAGLYMCFTVSDHWWFFRNAEKTEAGTAAAQALGADDIKCNGMVLMRIEGSAARYRCPEGLVYGSYLNKPFVPWPTYHEGLSVKLKVGIDKMMKEAVRP